MRTKIVAQHPIYTPPRHAVEDLDNPSAVNPLVGVIILAHDNGERPLGLCAVGNDIEVERSGLMVYGQLDFSFKLCSKLTRHDHPLFQTFVRFHAEVAHCLDFVGMERPLFLRWKSSQVEAVGRIWYGCSWV